MPHNKTGRSVKEYKSTCIMCHVLLTYLVSEDLGQDAGLLFQTRHTGENLRAALHHVCCVARTWMPHVGGEARANQKQSMRGDTLRQVSLKPRHRARACKRSLASPTIETHRRPLSKGQWLNNERGCGAISITHGHMTALPLSLPLPLTRRVFDGVVEILVDLHGVVALQSVTNQQETSRRWAWAGRYASSASSLWCTRYCMLLSPMYALLALNGGLVGRGIYIISYLPSRKATPGQDRSTLSSFSPLNFASASSSISHSPQYHHAMYL